MELIKYAKDNLIKPNIIYTDKQYDNSYKELSEFIGITGKVFNDFGTI